MNIISKLVQDYQEHYGIIPFILGTILNDTIEWLTKHGQISVHSSHAGFNFRNHVQARSPCSIFITEVMEHRHSALFTEFVINHRYLSSGAMPINYRLLISPDTIDLRLNRRSQDWYLYLLNVLGVEFPQSTATKLKPHTYHITDPNSINEATQHLTQVFVELANL